MKRLGMLVIFLLSSLTVGCAGHYNVPMVDVTATPPDLVQKIPLNVAILITDQMENYTFTGQANESSIYGTYTFPFGQMIRKNIFDILSPAFNKAVIVKGKPYPQDIDVIIVAKVEKFQHWYVGAGAFTATVVAKISIKLAVYDMKAALVWEGIISSPKVEKIYSAPVTGDFLGATGSVAAESVVAALQEAAKVITSSREIHAFVSAKGISETIASKPSGKELPIVKSDVDKPFFGVTDKIMGDNDMAVVIGVEKYQDLPASDYSSSDAKLMKEYLVSLGVKERNIELLLNERATQSSIKKTVETWLPNRVKSDSKVVIYYSGHGAPDAKTGNAYIVPFDGDPNYLEDTGYPLKRLYDKLGKLQVAEVIVLLDSCFSGAGGRSVLAKGARPLVMMVDTGVLSSNMAVLSATQGTQISTSSPEKGHGVFTYYFLKALKDGKKDIAEIYSYIKPLVEDEAKQINVQQSPSVSPDVEKLKGRFGLRK
ncbi:MAG: polysaccharide deacetylase [Nitrospirae bacterium]|nr:MAG: polysaccharide deacetylase [Nitrospirota bacterium]